jgi:hypothetical protein
MRASTMQPSSEQTTGSHGQLALLAADEETDRAPPAQAAGEPLVGRRYKQGQDLRQAMLLPTSVDDYVAADNAVRGDRGLRGLCGGCQRAWVRA